LTNSMFPLNVDELKVDNRSPITTYTYQIINVSITSRKEKRNQKTIKPWHLTKDNSIVIGERRNHPFKVKGLLGISAMSYADLSKSAVKALSQGVAISGGSFMNTGEGGISPYQLSIVYQVVEGTSVPTDRLEKKVDCFIKEFPHASNFHLEK